MTYMEYRNPIFQQVPRKSHISHHFPPPQYRDYFWNDSSCEDDVAHYICVKECHDCPTGAPPSQ